MVQLEMGLHDNWLRHYANGNMLSYSTPFSGYRFAYGARNRQNEAFVGAIGTSWLINGLGQRIAQINVSVPEFYFVYDEAGHRTDKYDGLGNPLGRRRGSATCRSPCYSPARDSISRPTILARRIRSPE